VSPATVWRATAQAADRGWPVVRITGRHATPPSDAGPRQQPPRPVQPPIQYVPV